MNPLRVAAGLLFVGGLAAGTLSDTDTSRTPRQADGYWILAADFHVHSFFGDGALAPWDLGREAQRRGLDVIAITNHHSTIAGRMAGSQPGDLPLLIPGQEVTAPGYHITAIGITQPIDWRHSAAQAIDAIHAQGGAAIAAHPTRNYWPAFDPVALKALDGVEVAHPSTKSQERARRDFPAFYRRARAQKAGIAPIGASDFHFHAPLGLCRTYVFTREISARAIVDAVRQGRTVAYDDVGRATGDPSLVRLVERQRAGATARPSAWPTIAAACAWVGLLGLVLL